MTKANKKSPKDNSESTPKKSSKKTPKVVKKDDQLQSDVSEYEPENVIFSDVVESTIPGGTMKYKRINITTKNSDGTVGALIIPTERLFCFGVGENRDSTTGKLGGYSMNVALWSKDGRSEGEKVWTDKFSEICSHIKTYLIDNADEEHVALYDKVKNVGEFNPMYWKREKGVIVEGTGPTLYVKLMTGFPKKKGAKGKKDEEKQEPRNEEDMKIYTDFFDKDTGEPIDAKSLIGQYFFAQISICIEGIYIGGKNVTLQLKAREVSVERLQSNRKQLLARPKPSVRVLTAGGATNLNDLSVSDDEAEKPKKKEKKPVAASPAGSVVNSDVEESPKKEKKPKKKEKKIKKVNRDEDEDA